MSDLLPLARAIEDLRFLTPNENAGGMRTVFLELAEVFYRHGHASAAIAALHMAVTPPPEPEEDEDVCDECDD